MSLYYPPTKNAVQKTLDSQLDAGTTSSMTLNNVTSIQNKPGVCVLGRIDSSGAELPASGREFIAYTGTSGSTLTGLTRNVDGSSTDQDHAVGTIIEFIPDVVWAQGIMDAIAGVVDSNGNPYSTSPQIVTSINDSNDNELLKLTATASAVNEFTLTNAATGNSPSLSMSGGDSNIGLDMKMKGTGKLRKPTVVGIQVLDAATNTAVGDGKAFLRVPAELNGMNLTGVAACVYTAGTTGNLDITILNKTDSADMLSTAMRVETGETDTSTSAQPGVIDTTKDDVVAGDVIAINIDSVQTTAAKGLYVELRFELP